MNASSRRVVTPKLALHCKPLQNYVFFFFFFFFLGVIYLILLLCEARANSSKIIHTEIQRMSNPEDIFVSKLLICSIVNRATLLSFEHITDTFFIIYQS